jgi:hypothetical protein
MIEFIFTLDYELYGNGTGSLRDLVYEPTRNLAAIFRQNKATFVLFVETAELLKIQEYAADEAFDDVRTQLRELYAEGFEIGLHIHPWWFNAHRHDGHWRLDWSEYNLCTLPAARVDLVIQHSIEYLREAIADSSFVPLSFRAGLWLTQPTKVLSGALAAHGVRIDSSVFKGGRQRNLDLDYRPALKNGYSWRFSDDVNRPENAGALLEIPIYTEMVPFWVMLGAKRLRVHRRKVAIHGPGGPPRSLRDLAGIRYPRKLDYCRMTHRELQSAIRRITDEDSKTPELYKPIVAIGHSKDLVDFAGVRLLISELKANDVPISDFRSVEEKLRNACPPI